MSTLLSYGIYIKRVNDGHIFEQDNVMFSQTVQMEFKVFDTPPPHHTHAHLCPHNQNRKNGRVKEEIFTYIKKCSYFDYVYLFTIS